MNLSPLVLAIALLGMSGNLQAARTVRKGTHRVHKNAAASTATHKVRRGETAAKIAHLHGLTLDELAVLNPKTNLSKVSIGTLLKISGAKGNPKSTHLLAASQPLGGGTPELPVTPKIPPSSLLHMERMLPSSLSKAAPEAPTTASPMGEIRPVLPQSPAPQSAALPTVPFEPADPEKLDLLWPVETRTVSSAWGPRMRTRTAVKVKANRKRKVKVRYCGSHKGVDLNAPSGSDVYAALDGQVIAAGRHKQYGNFVVIDHGNGVTTLYAHNTKDLVQEGDIVRRGQKIAIVGRTGRATGPHLHFELRVDGIHRNPLPVLNDGEEISAEMMAQNQATPPQH